jgi:hypothetical protein
MSCINKNIDKFCNEFISLNINMGGFTGPTLEVEMLDSGSFNAEGIISRLNDYGIPLSTDWVVVSETRSKSSSGIITKIKMMDSIWRKANNTHIGLKHKVHGDIELGDEYFSVTGVKVGSETGPDANFLMEYKTLKKYYANLNSGNTYISSNIVGGVPKWDIAERPFNISKETLLDQFVKGLPDPNVEFGSIYYTAGKLFNEIQLSTGPVNPALLLNNTGTQYSVVNSIASMYGYVYSANGVKHDLVRLTNNYGSASELNVTIPDEAVSSSVQTDYTSGYSASAKKFVEVPGRYFRDDKAGNVITSITTNNNYMAIEGTYRSANYIADNLDTKAFFGLNSNNYPTLTDYAFVTAAMGDRDALETYGKGKILLKYLTGFDIIKQNIVDRLTIDETIAPKSKYTFYEYGNDQLFSDYDPLYEAYQSLTGRNAYDFENLMKVGADGLHSAYFRNLGRFSVLDGANGGKDFTRNGDGYVIPQLYQDSEGFENFGTQTLPTGTKNWFSPTGGEVTFVGFNEIVAETVFKDALYGLDNEHAFGTVFDFFREFPFSAGGIIGQRAQSGGYEVPYGLVVIDRGESFVPSGISMNIRNSSLYLQTSSTGRIGMPTGQLNIAAYNRDFEDLVEYRFGEIQDYLNEKVVDPGEERERATSRVAFFGFEDNPDFGLSSSIADSNGLPTSYGANATEATQTENINPIRIAQQRQRIPAETACDEAGSLFNRNFYSFNVDIAVHDIDRIDNQGNSIPTNSSVQYLTDDGRIESSAFETISEANCGGEIESLDKVSFTLINSLYAGSLEDLENLSITINAGKLRASYTFSKKVIIPDFKGLAAADVKLQNLIG